MGRVNSDEYANGAGTGAPSSVFGMFSPVGFGNGYATQATAASTTTLTVASALTQFFTGSTTQNCRLPVVSTLPATGWTYTVVNISTGVVTVQSSGSNTVLAMPPGSSAMFIAVVLSGTSAAVWQAVVLSNNNAGNLTPTVQRLTTGTAATYTAPVSPRPPLYIMVECLGGGGGGGGSGTASVSSDGTAGNATTWSVGTLSAGGGAGGTWGGNSGLGGSGGTGSLGTGTGTSQTGMPGGGGPKISVINTVELGGGLGGNGYFGGGGKGGTQGGAGIAASTNSGGGGGGAGHTNNVNVYCGSGGGAGAYVRSVMANPTTATYSVGGTAAGGGAGTSGFAGGTGAAGLILVTEYYQ